MLNTAVLGTEEFLAWVGETSPLKTSQLTPSAIRKQLSSKLCAIVVPDRHGYGPEERPLVLVDERKTRDFFAFVSTYVTEYSPFTAFFRVMTSDHIELLADEPSLTVGHAARTIEKFVGVAIIEAALYLRSRGSNDGGKSITLPAANATYSAAAIQGLTLGAQADVSAIGRGWRSLRSMVGGEQLPVDLDALARLWEVLRLAVYGGGSVHHTAEEVTIIGAMWPAAGFSDTELS